MVLPTVIFIYIISPTHAQVHSAIYINKNKIQLIHYKQNQCLDSRSRKSGSQYQRLIPGKACDSWVSLRTVQGNCEKVNIMLSYGVYIQLGSKL